MKLQDIQIRDPYIFVEDGRYIMVGTTDPSCWAEVGYGFNAFVSNDLIDWTPMGPVFEKSPDFWATKNFWAPELHKFSGSYYLLASFKSNDRCRATCALKSDSPLGPFRPFGADQLTPKDWECLDGTLHVDESGKPWLVFCHEWLQVGDGEICAVLLKDDLSGPDGEPVVLFRASEAKWVVEIHSGDIYGRVTDGPFMFKNASGQLCMLWSSNGTQGYAISYAVSEGGVLGPWKQTDEPLFGKDGGHGMLFTSLEGQLILSIHSPNNTPCERPLFIPVKLTQDGLVRADQNNTNSLSAEE